MLSRLSSKLLLAIGLLAGFTPSAQARLLDIKDFAYKFQPAELGSDVWVSYTLVDKGNFQQLRARSAVYKQVTDAILPGGIGDLASCYGLIIRNTYLVKRSRDRYVRVETLFDVAYLEKILLKFGIRKLSSTLFQIPEASFSPGYKIEQNLYGSSEEVKTAKRIDLAKLPLVAVGAPLVLVQDSSDFGTIMGQKTSRDGRVINAYYEISPEVFMVESITLTHLHNIPPGLLGGAARLKRDYLKAIEQSVLKIQAHQP